MQGTYLRSNEQLTHNATLVDNEGFDNIFSLFNISQKNLLKYLVYCNLSLMQLIKRKIKSEFLCLGLLKTLYIYTLILYQNLP